MNTASTLRIRQKSDAIESGATRRAIVRENGRVAPGLVGGANAGQGLSDYGDRVGGFGIGAVGRHGRKRVGPSGQIAHVDAVRTGGGDAQRGTPLEKFNLAEAALGVGSTGREDKAGRGV